MALVDINWHPAPRELRVFSFLACAMFALLAGLSWIRWGQPAAAAACGIVAGIVVAVGCLVPSLLRPMYVVWMAAVFPIGWVVSHTVMAGIFYGVVTPVGLALRLLGKDPLSRRWDEHADTYWRERQPTHEVDRYFRQY